MWLRTERATSYEMGSLYKKNGHFLRRNTAQQELGGKGHYEADLWVQILRLLSITLGLLIIINFTIAALFIAFIPILMVAIVCVGFKIAINRIGDRFQPET